MTDQFEEEMRVIASALPPAPILAQAGIKPAGNGQRHAAAAPATAYDFEDLGQRIAEGMLETAKEQLVQAENMLKQTEMFAEDIRSRVASKAAELSDMNNRLRTFGSTIVTAHQVFLGKADEKK